jgi:hypothetical protein
VTKVVVSPGDGGGGGDDDDTKSKIIVVVCESKGLKGGSEISRHCHIQRKKKSHQIIYKWYKNRVCAEPCEKIAPNNVQLVQKYHTKKHKKSHQKTRTYAEIVCRAVRTTWGWSGSRLRHANSRGV